MRSLAVFKRYPQTQGTVLAGHNAHTRGRNRTLRYTVKGIVRRIGVREDHQLARLLFGEKDIVIGIELLHRTRVDTELVLKAHDKIYCPLSLLESIQIPN